jgi:hypothetical protein
MALIVVTTILFLGLISLLLVVLTLMRVIVDLRCEVQALTSLITQPPEPTFLGKQIPEQLAAHFTQWQGTGHGEQVVAVLFLREGCEGCRMLVVEVQRAIAKGRLKRQQLWAVVEDYEEDLPMVRDAAASSDAVIRDEDGTLRSTCQVLGTPTIFIIRLDTLQLLSYELGGDAAWISRQLRSNPNTDAKAVERDARVEPSIVEGFSGI